MRLFRQILFWAHLTAGLAAGAFIGIMCFTGTVLAFEEEIVTWAERDARRVSLPAEVTRLPIDTLQSRLHAAQSDYRPTSVIVKNDPGAAVTFNAGRDSGFHLDPYTGEIRQPASTKVREFMQTMLVWHRYLARDGDQRPLGKLINGTCNLVFCTLAITGLYLWWPRSFTWRGVKAIAIFNWRLSGKARDFNWHNAIGLWSAPILIILTLTAVPISFRWGGDLINRLAGETPSSQPTPRPANSATDASAPLNFEFILTRTQRDFPGWKQLTLRPTGQSPTLIVRESGSWPRTANTTITLDPTTGEELKREAFGDLTAARQIRSWTRFLHTGQALGWPGQLIAGLACLGGCFLVYTGFALSWRRFFPKRPTSASSQ